ncbi:hypothetical protein [Stutzerimonas nitrititolerans]|uniref:hypothetical protein n=1 Tax=Stutzerimonas nitrititolerans TaxID=2482751 RepID=UPI0028AF91FA|nr:hypothetical protein [Stutzerimonas nitrititolerans]
MMNITEKIKSISHRFEIKNETIDQVLIDLQIDELSKFRSLNKTLDNSFFISKAVIDGDTLAFPIPEASFTGEEFQISINKKLPSHAAIFFSEKGFVHGLTNKAEIEKRTAIFIDANFESFETKTCKFEQLANLTTLHNKEAPQKINFNSRNIIKDATGKHLQTNIEFWITQEAGPKQENSVYETWKKHSFNTLALMLCSEIWKSEEGLKLVFNGQQKREATFYGALESINDELFSIITKSCYWLAESERESDIRHALIISRIASHLKEEQKETWEHSLPKLLPYALNDARNDYKAHIHSKTAETLKAIAELRKAIAEETAKVVERTHNLSNTLFKDIALAFSVISIRALSLSSNGSLKHETSSLLAFSAIWMLFNLWTVTNTNSSYIRSLARSRFSWSRKVNHKIPTSEFKELSERPFKEAVNSYKRILKNTKFFYFFIVFALFIIPLYGYRAGLQQQLENFFKLIGC